MSRSPLARVLVVGAAILLILLGLGYSVYAGGRADLRQTVSSPGAPASVPGEVNLRETGRLVFRVAAPGPDYGYLATVPADAPGGTRTVHKRECERFYAAAGHGLCLTADRGAVSSSYHAVILDAGLGELRRIRLAGPPSRARVSPSGRMASWTVFIAGDSYAGTNFSTRTAILDTVTGALVPDLEAFTVSVDGALYQAPDRNFWGVTFARDDNRFYATMASKGKTWLIEGDVAKREARTLRENVECPSLSPDGTRVAYKKRVSSDAGRPWRLHVLDVRTMHDVALAETASVDDQAAWFDEHTVMYALPDEKNVSDIMAVPADGSGSPRLFVAGGYSPAVLR